VVLIESLDRVEARDPCKQFRAHSLGATRAVDWYLGCYPNTGKTTKQKALTLSRNGSAAQVGGYDSTDYAKPDQGAQTSG
jgi:hypothetical protein